MGRRIPDQSGSSEHPKTLQVPSWETEGQVYRGTTLPSPRDSKRHWTGYQDVWERAISAAGLPGRRVYDLRSTFATRALELYPHNIAVARMLRHKTPVILDTYAKATDASGPLIVHRLNEFRSASYTRAIAN